MEDFKFFMVTIEYFFVKIIYMFNLQKEHFAIVSVTTVAPDKKYDSLVRFFGGMVRYLLENGLDCFLFGS